MSRTAKTLTTAAILGLMMSSGAALADSQSFDYKDFTKISLDGLVDATIVQGKGFKVEAQGSPEAMSNMTVSQNGDELIVRSKKDGNINIKKFSELEEYTLNVTITMPMLTSLEVDGLSDVVLDDWALENLYVEIDGIVDFDASGTCNSIEFRIDGMSDVNADKLKCKSVEVRLDGIGSADVYASEDVDARVDGMAKVKVYGNPKKQMVKESGFSGVHFVD